MRSGVQPKFPRAELRGEAVADLADDAPGASRPEVGERVDVQSPHATPRHRGVLPAGPKRFHAGQPWALTTTVTVNRVRSGLHRRADPEVMRWIGDGSVRTRQQTKAGIEAWERDWERWGFGLFALEMRTTGELAGFTGLAVPEFLPEVMPAVEIGWRLGRRFWGAGLATEAARAVPSLGQ